MRLTFDPAKNERNIAERGIPFATAEGLDWSTALMIQDLRKAYPVRRFQVLGLIREDLHMLVFTPRDGAGACDQPS
jgi:uncharacterized DUF497 family protein